MVADCRVVVDVWWVWWVGVEWCGGVGEGLAVWRRVDGRWVRAGPQARLRRERAPSAKSAAPGRREDAAHGDLYVRVTVALFKAWMIASPSSPTNLITIIRPTWVSLRTRRRHPFW